MAKPGMMGHLLHLVIETAYNSRCINVDLIAKGLPPRAPERELLPASCLFLKVSVDTDWVAGDRTVLLTAEFHPLSSVSGRPHAAVIGYSLGRGGHG